MIDNLPSVAALLAELDAFGTAVSRIVSPSGVDWQWHPDSDEWCLTEVMCHLRDVEIEVHQPRFRDLIASDNPFLSGTTADDWIVSRGYHDSDGPDALQTFMIARRQTVVMLGEVKDETFWERRGRHAYFGPTSMHELLHLVVSHDRAHWQQIMKLVYSQTSPAES